MAVDARNYFEEGMDQFNYNYNPQQPVESPILALGDNADVLQGVIEDIRMRTEAYGKNQIQEGPITQGSSMMGTNIPEVMGPGQSDMVAQERGLDLSSQGMADRFAGAQGFMNPPPEMSSPGANIGVAESRIVSHSGYHDISMPTSSDISNQVTPSAVPPSSGEMNNSAGRLGFILNQQ